MEQSLSISYFLGETKKLGTFEAIHRLGQSDQLQPVRVRTSITTAISQDKVPVQIT